MSQASKHSFPVPFCLFIGPQRSGTSWLYRYFVERGDICLPLEVKEIFFFDKQYHKGDEFYRSHFDVKPEHKLAMEITTTSFNNAQARQNIYEYFGKDVRLVCPLRHPVMRSYSLYRHYQRYGMVHKPLSRAIEECPEIITSSHYADHIKEWVELFGRDNIQFTFQEHLAQDQEGYIRTICDEIGLPYKPVGHELQGKYNATAEPPCYYVARAFQKMANVLRSFKLYGIINFAKKMGLKKLVFGDANPDHDPVAIPEEDRKLLEELLGDEVRKLEELLGHKIEYWHN